MGNRLRPSRPARLAIKPALAAALLFGLSLATWAMDRVSLGVQPMVYAFGYGYMANALPFALLFLLLLALCNRLLLALLLTLLAAAALYLANYLKLRYLLQPVQFSDVFVLRELHLSTLHLLSNYLHGPWPLAGVALLLAVLASARYEPGFFRARSLPRWVLLALLLALPVGNLASGRAWASRLYEPVRLRVVPWSPVLTVLHGGLASALLYDDVQYASALRRPADPAAIAAFLRLPVPPAPAAPAAPAKPDIVVVQSESFFDPAALRDIADTAELLPNLQRAQAQGLSGTMTVPTFGGGTLRTEFEVLTGVPMSAYPELDFPYLQINRPHIPSLVQALHDDGYAAYAVHPNDGNFWNRRKAFAAMGFDRFVSLQDFPQDARHDGWYLADSALTAQIEALLDKATARPVFVMAISIEGHGPYAEVPVADHAARDRIPVPAGWPADAANEYRNYAYHIANADRELGRLWDYLRARGRPFVLAFYGDHLPGLEHVYASAAGFDDGREATAQSVPWLLIGSDGGARPQGRHIHAWMLGSEVLGAAGLDRPGYYALVDRADRILAGPDGAASRATVLQGIESLARLHLLGQPMPAAPRAGSAR
ncbi:LTA synthase family protein [Fulvimonas soli]|uniref:Phosphoglycerol transferase MdoB-like AlkP superfamily enzyme n=1 Tax=Fulvimonas soli TaxID=155197 RepID=A0A316I0D5_9GAMM|nr:LTA synthase family protein [Fulvimonas soli]PWK85712.1 phosphoglycerol transferase MdoB-like AlkP superfamily enzyme [Fulvimonas soli]TNY25664.1 hypothetical protein BV497_12315 [Fulvimonas soli]